MELKKLNLSIPSMDSDDCKSLMGGDGYIMLDEVVVVAPGNGRPDDEYDPFLENDHDENDQDENYSTPDDAKDDIPDERDESRNDSTNNTSDTNNSGFNLNLLLEKAQTQYGNTCTFAAMYAILCGYGLGDSTTWENIALAYAQEHNVPIGDIFSGKFGLSPMEFNDLVEQYFNVSGYVTSQGSALMDALEDGSPVLGIIDIDGTPENSEEDTMHAVAVIGYNEDTQTVTYWDPQTGEISTCPLDAFKVGWDIDGVK